MVSSHLRSRPSRRLQIGRTRTSNQIGYLNRPCSFHYRLPMLLSELLSGELKITLHARTSHGCRKQSSFLGLSQQHNYPHESQKRSGRVCIVYS